MGDTAFARPLMPRAARKRTATPPKRTPRASDARSAPRPRAGGGEHPAPGVGTPRPAWVRIKGLWGSSAHGKHAEISKPRAPARAARAPAARENGGALACAAARGCAPFSHAAGVCAARAGARGFENSVCFP